jgi:hypothetical protein
LSGTGKVVDVTLAQPNDRLRDLMLRRRVSLDRLAIECEVERKSVERWLYRGRVPYRRNRRLVAMLLETDEAYLWPGQQTAIPGPAAIHPELVDLYTDRASVPRKTWLRLLDTAQGNIDILVNSGAFLAQLQPRIAGVLADRAREGVQIRLCFGDPDCDAVAVRDAEEGLDGTLGAKIRASLTLYRRLAGTYGVQVRLHRTTLYTSIFRYDDEMIVNHHVYGEPASLNPTLYLRRAEGGLLVDHYRTSYERVWNAATPWPGEQAAPPGDTEPVRQVGDRR